ncbi:MAG TPA: metalloregulator ArsR/SmtB family transcription factor [Gemmatimonadaceae bacterium]|nr:metalloregulator ArsR/SmtB family transcription factor [Gemmatimonadaceae bacterium]
MVYHSDALDRTFGALADPTRRDILSRLATGDRTISELAARFDMSLPAVSKHVRVLHRAGLATVERDGRVRRAKLRVTPMRRALAWIEHYRRFWERELDLLATYLEHPASESSTPISPPEATWKDKPQHRRRSKSGAPFARRSNASSTRGRKRKN